jgi:hypothetical protein
MKTIAGSLLVFLASGCTGLCNFGDYAVAQSIDENAAKSGADPRLHVGMPIDDAMDFLEGIGFKRQSGALTWSNGAGTSARDERPSFLYTKGIPTWSLAEGSAVISIWLYYEAGKLIDIRVKYRSMCL